MLKKLFGRTISLELDEFADFLESNSDKRLSKINNRIHEIVSKNKHIIENINYLLDTISHYNLNQEKFEDMEFKLIKASINTVRNETRDIIGIIKEETNHLKLRDEAEEFKKRYEVLKIELKDHFRKIEPHFKDLITPFVERLRDLSENIKAIEETLNNKAVEEYYMILSEIEKLNRILPDKEVTKDLSKIKSNILKLSVRLSALQDKKETMMLTEQFKMSKKTYNDNKEIKEKIKDIREDIEDMFINIRPLLSVYNKKFYSRIINNYIESPSQALLNDKNIDIVDSLKKIEGMILKEKIKISKNKEEIHDSIKSIQKTKLKNLKQKLEKLEEEHQRKKILLTKNKIMLDMIELDYQMDHLTGKIKQYENQLKSQEPIDEVESKRLIDDIMKKISDFTDKKIRLKEINS